MSTARYLSLKEVGERIGSSNPAARGYHLPEPDALIGTTRGWLPETIDAWNAARPGRGAGGGRPRKNRNQADSPTARRALSASAARLAADQWVYPAVVLILAWPIIAFLASSGAPASARCVEKKWRALRMVT